MSGRGWGQGRTYMYPLTSLTSQTTLETGTKINFLSPFPISFTAEKYDGRFPEGGAATSTEKEKENGGITDSPTLIRGRTPNK